MHWPDYLVTGSVCVTEPKGRVWQQLLRNVTLSAHVFFRFWVGRRITIGSGTLQLVSPGRGAVASNHKQNTYSILHEGMRDLSAPALNC